METDKNSTSWGGQTDTSDETEATVGGTGKCGAPSSLADGQLLHQ